MDVTVTFKIKEIRQSKKYSLRVLSSLSGVSYAQISDIENAKKQPTICTLCMIAIALDVDVRLLFDYCSS